MVILDPQFTESLPPSITAISGVDALCQAIESCWSINSTRQSKKYAKEAIAIILSNLKSAVKNPSHRNRLNMVKAANLAGKAINISKTTAPHALSYTLTSNFNVPHGQAVSVFLPPFLEYNYQYCKDIYKLKNKILELMMDIGLKITLSELGIHKKTDLKKILDNVDTERLINNPRKITKSDLKNIIKQII